MALRVDGGRRGDRRGRPHARRRRSHGAGRPLAGRHRRLAPARRARDRPSHRSGRLHRAARRRVHPGGSGRRADGHPARLPAAPERRHAAQRDALRPRVDGVGDRRRRRLDPARAARQPSPVPVPAHAVSDRERRGPRRAGRGADRSERSARRHRRTQAPLRRHQHPGCDGQHVGRVAAVRRRVSSRRARRLRGRLRERGPAHLRPDLGHRHRSVAQPPRRPSDGDDARRPWSARVHRVGSVAHASHARHGGGLSRRTRDGRRRTAHACGEGPGGPAASRRRDALPPRQLEQGHHLPGHGKQLDVVRRLPPRRVRVDQPGPVRRPARRGHRRPTRRSATSACSTTSRPRPRPRAPRSSRTTSSSRSPTRAASRRIAPGPI